MPLNLFYTMVQKSQKWPKTQIKGGGPALSAYVWQDGVQSMGFPVRIHTDPDAVRSKKKKEMHNLSRDRTPLLIPIGSRSHIFRLGGVGKELQSTRKEKRDPPQRKIRQQVDEYSKTRKK